jgi:ABC-type Zn uptake system ZnuABC Zn-binding protein ZnuA
MKRYAETIVGLLAVVAALASGCSKGAGEDGGKNEPKIGVFVSILPQAYFVKRIGGEHAVAEADAGAG